MPWAVAAAAVAAVGSYASAQSSAKGAKKAAKESAEAQFKTKQYELQYLRKADLEDRLYKEKAIGGYRQFGTAGLASPEYTDPGADPVDPYAAKEAAAGAKKKKSKGGFGSHSGISTLKKLM